MFFQITNTGTLMDADLFWTIMWSILVIGIVLMIIVQGAMYIFFHER